MVTDGIGLATAERFIVEDVDKKHLTELWKTIGANNVTAVQGDISNMNDLDRLFDII